MQSNAYYMTYLYHSQYDHIPFLAIVKCTKYTTLYSIFRLMWSARRRQHDVMPTRQTKRQVDIGMRSALVGQPYLCRPYPHVSLTSDCLLGE